MKANRDPWAKQGLDAGGDTAGRVAMLIDTTMCTGCRACEASCIEEHALDTLAPSLALDTQASPAGTGPFGADRPLAADAWTTLRTIESQGDPPRWTFLKQQCLHCADAGCITICPSGAQRAGPRGETWTDLDRCIGCAACVVACPFDVPRLHPGDGAARKCDLCTERLARGSAAQPMCVQTCPAEALHFGPRETIAVMARERAARLREEGEAGATAYGIDEFGGLATILVLPASPEAFGLPARPQGFAGRAIAGWTWGIATSLALLLIPAALLSWIR